jgi:hypothetical protein
LKAPEVFEFYKELSLIGTRHSRYLLKTYPELNNNNIIYTLKKLYKYGDYSMFLKYIKEYPEYLDYIDEENMTLMIYILKLNKSYDDRGNNLNENGITDINFFGLKTEEVIIELLKYDNINLSHVDNDGNNAFMYICKNNYMCAFIEIIKKTDYDKYLINKDGYHALYLNSLVPNPDFLYFQNNLSGKIASKIAGIQTNFVQIQDLFMFQIICLVLQIIISLIMLFFVHIKLAILMMLWLVVLLPICFVSKKKLANLSALATHKKQEITGVINDAIANISTIFAFASKNKEQNEFLY